MYINCNKKLPMNELKPVEIKKEKISGSQGKLALFTHEMLSQHLNFDGNTSDVLLYRAGF